MRPDDRFLARVPVYSTQDAGRGFCKKFSKILLGAQLRENYILKAAYVLERNGELLGILATHVDDMIYAFDGAEGDAIIAYIKKYVTLSKEGE